MRTSMAYFAGAGTVIGAIVVGLGGGLLIANMVNPAPVKQGTETSVMERRKASEPVAVKVGPSEPVQYLATPQLSPPNAIVAAVPAQAATPTEPVVTAPPAVPPAAVAAAAPATPTAEPTTAREPRRASPDDSFAKAQEADVRRDAEVKRLVDKRKADRERRQQSADRRRSQPREAQELREVEQAVRDQTEPRSERVLAAEPVRTEMPQIKLFGSE